MAAQHRLQRAVLTQTPGRLDQQPLLLTPFAGNPREGMPKGLPFRLQDYIELVDWAGRVMRDDKRGYINKTVPPILARPQLDTKNWLYLTQHFESPFKHGG